MACNIAAMSLSTQGHPASWVKISQGGIRNKNRNDACIVLIVQSYCGQFMDYFVFSI